MTDQKKWTMSLLLRLAANTLDDLPGLGRVNVEVLPTGGIEFHVLNDTDADNATAVDALTAYLRLGTPGPLSTSAGRVHYGVRGERMGVSFRVVTILSEAVAA